MIALYNTLTRRKEAFQPLESNKVRMYCCGITAYDYCHLGHARTCLVWDVARRYLQWRGFEVTYIQNFTDIDDKILKRARTEETSMEAVAERFIAAYFEDLERLQIGKADAYPRATHTLNGIKRLVTELEAKGYAYPSGGDVYYSVRKFADYGKLSGRKFEEMQAGASGRVEVQDPEEAKKQDPFDFALWKGSKPGEPSWESPWGAGRPGWHIECSAMVRDRLGETIDIHVGGSDLIFPHHENEIAQSEAATGKPLARYWMHSGMVRVGGEKMSKSLGNFTTIRDLLDGKGSVISEIVDPMAVRLFILQTHYRNPLDFTPEALEAATNGWHTLREGLLFGQRYGEKLGWNGDKTNEALQERFAEATDDDLNFAGGLAVLFEVAKELRKEGNLLVHEGKTETPAEVLEGQWRTLVELSSVLGLAAELEAETEVKSGLGEAEIEDAIARRTAAKGAKNFAEADRIRDELKAQGVLLIDKPGGVTLWHRE
ncbi:cysteine--tRNA ligase [Oscillatoria sp. FACHB-1406]|uniref:cysteine--tRNA ligase n=1 Tax=Oscillatoria sp. FACHB-1406 TaxID=2692846 RepID=UPI001689F566|nr:cysteine--tRNA ligase [Oscillatoria sp. FACHB-1406]MBD2576323.1 cysteine--tRNA ligase [Oscillatoria sp. FACHB-1406]